MAELHSRRVLIERAVHEDRLALTMLLSEAEAGLRRRLACRIPLDMQGAFDADDLLQLVHADAFRGIGGFRPGGDDAFDRWLAAIATMRVRQEIRRQRAKKRPPERRRIVKTANDLNQSTKTLIDLIEARDLTPSRIAASHEAVAAVRAALKELPEAFRDAVRMVYLEGFTVAQAAEAMGRTERAIHNLCFKAKKKLRNLLGSESRFLSRST